MSRLLVGDSRISIPKTAVARARGARVLVGSSFRVRGLDRIVFDDGADLLLGTHAFGFEDDRTQGLLRIRGELRIRGRVKMAVGTRIDVGPSGVMDVGDKTYFSPRVRAVVASGLSIGGDCAIAWDVQFLDDDFHVYEPSDGAPGPRALPIVLGDHVWVGSGAKIFKGVRIADGCVVAGGAVVTRSFDDPHTLIAGSPARAVRSGVGWH